MPMRVSSSPAAKILIIFILITFVVGISLTSILALLPQKVVVPDFIGMSANDAAALANKSGLALKTTTTSSADYDHGLVVSQNPPAGQKVSSGTTVEVAINR